MKKLYPIPTFSFFFLLFSYLTFILGFYFNENSSGGGLVDFSHEWKSINEFKLGIFSELS